MPHWQHYILRLCHVPRGAVLDWWLTQSHVSARYRQYQCTVALYKHTDLHHNVYLLLQPISLKRHHIGDKHQ